MNIVPFNYQGREVRSITIDGEPYFIPTDVCAVLGHTNPSQAVAQHVHEDDVRTATLTIREGSRMVTRDRSIVNESGLYALIFGSTLPEARDFKRWVTGEVLPSIRKTGAYTVKQSLPASYSEALRELAATVEERDALTAKVAADAPKVGYMNRFVADRDLRLLRNVAKSLGMKESTLRQALIAHRWIYVEKQDRWSQSEQRKVSDYRYSAYAGKTAYFSPEPNHEAPRFKGEVMHTLKVTPQGAEAIARAVERWQVFGEVA